MFCNGDSKTNGEAKFYADIKDSINVIFDVGCRSDSEYTSFPGTVHYFDPVDEHIQQLKKQTTANKCSYYNNFGLGDEEQELYYYPRYQSFFNRIISCHESDDANKIRLKINKGKDYVVANNITTVDFLKIDTEGYELKVLQGFGDFLQHIKIIQFEYGGTFLDNNTRLFDVINFLEQHGFHKFSYLTNYGTELITDFRDHYNYCNIVCVNKQSDFVPF